MRDIFTIAEADARGLTRRARNWGVKQGRLVSGGRGTYLDGGAPSTALERSIAGAKATGGAISGSAAGEFLKLDSVLAKRIDFTVAPGASNARKGARRRAVETMVVDGVCVTTGTQTMLDLAAVLTDAVWEQALESALRQGLTTIAEIEAALPRMGRARRPGVALIRRVLALRPAGAPPTESLLETFAVQLFRDAGFPTPTRQYVVRIHRGAFESRLDLAWPELGIFVELDGQGHTGQPVYDASRQTAVVAATGWLCARFTWYEINRAGAACVKELRDIFTQAGLKHGSAH